MKDLGALLVATTGLAPSGADLERATRERMAQLGLVSSSDYAPQPGTPEFAALVELLVVPESWMLRDPAVFAQALAFVQARLAAHPDKLVRILSLPCAGGEEPYSMALTLAQAGIPAARCRIDGIDLSHAAVARARLGAFTRNAFRGADLAFRERWFTHSGGAYLVDPALRDYVTFSQGNVLAPDALGPRAPYDLVFCRNLLIYFDDATCAAAAHAIGALLADDGLLLSGYAEAPAFCRHGFATGKSMFGLVKQGANVPAATAAARPRARKPAPVVPARATAPAATARASAPVGTARSLSTTSALTSASTPSSTLAATSAAAPVPAGPQDWLALAREHADAGRLPDAEAACRALLALAPDSADAWFLLGVIKECAGLAHAAEDAWRRCVYLAPDHYEALCRLALLHEERGDAAAGAGLRQRAARIFERRGSVAA